MCQRFNFSLLSDRLKFGLHFAGGAFALIGIVYIYKRINLHAAEINLAVFNASIWAVLAILATVYGLANLMLAQAWQKILKHFGVSVAVPWAIWAYGVSQIAKYIPGNIFHLAGRQALGAAAGLPQWPLAKSTLWELGLIASAGTILGLLVLPLLTEYVTPSGNLVLFVSISVLTLIVFKHIYSREIVLAFFYYLGFLLISGILFIGLIELFSARTAEIEVKDWLPLIGAYVVAWLAGFITPGAPAGIGVRELVLLFLLKGILGETELLMAVAIGRLVTSSGDGLFFIASSIYGRRFFSKASI